MRAKIDRTPMTSRARDVFIGASCAVARDATRDGRGVGNDAWETGAMDACARRDGANDETDGVTRRALFATQVDQTRREALKFAAGAVATLGLAKSANAADDVASSRMSYSRFLEYLDMGRVTVSYTHLTLPTILLV